MSFNHFPIFSLVVLVVAMASSIDTLATSTAKPATVEHKLPDGFVYLWQFYEKEIRPKKPHLAQIREHLRYATEENFTGDIVPGYHPNASHAVLTTQAAHALYVAQEAALATGHSLLIYDSYRPQSSVNAFLSWARQPDNCTKCRANYFPTLKVKLDAFKEPDRYVAPKSRHSGGSTVDLTLIKVGSQVAHPPSVHRRTLRNNETVNYLEDGSVDMYTSFDLMHYASWPEGHGLLPVSGPYLGNRHLFGKIMSDAGFVQLPREWWHFTLKNEPFPESFFDFKF